MGPIRGSDCRLFLQPVSTYRIVYHSIFISTSKKIFNFYIIFTLLIKIFYYHKIYTTDNKKMHEMAKIVHAIPSIRRTLTYNYSDSYRRVTPTQSLPFPRLLAPQRSGAACSAAFESPSWPMPSHRIPRTVEVPEWQANLRARQGHYTKVTQSIGEITRCLCRCALPWRVRIRGKSCYTRIITCMRKSGKLTKVKRWNITPRCRNCYCYVSYRSCCAAAPARCNCSHVA